MLNLRNIGARDVALRIRIGTARIIGLRAAELRSELLVGGVFMLAAVALSVLGGGEEGLSLPIAALYVVSVAVAGHVRFDVGAGFTVPTQAVFVPMLFALPVAVVPLLVALSLALGMAPGVLRGNVPVSRF